MTTPTRVANKTGWALDDILKATKEAQGAWRGLHVIAKARMDPALLAGLAEIRDAIAIIERKARLARAGDYDEYDTERRPEEANLTIVGRAARQA